MKCLICGGTDNARSSTSEYPYCIKSKAEAHKKSTKNSIIKAILNSTCKDANMIL